MSKTFFVFFFQKTELVELLNKFNRISKNLDLSMFLKQVFVEILR